MIERFQGEAGRRALLDVLRRNKIVEGNEELAAALADAGSLRSISVGDLLIREGDSDTSVHFILAGLLSVHVKGSKVAVRGAGEVIGETSAIDPSRKRSATLVANEESIVLEVSGDNFINIADKFQNIWRSLAFDLARRLVQRNSLVNAVNDQVKVFVICSVEALDVAQEIQAALSYENMLVTLWTNGVFIASNYPLESLEDALQQSDFAIAVAHPDDQTVVRGEHHRTPRDNVIFELGFFMGRLGRKRTLLLEPRGENLKLPTDLIGITTIGYRSGPASQLPSLIGPACTEIKKIVTAMGPKQ